jgi:hypothetical protein
LPNLSRAKTNLQALRDNADYTRRAEERNFQIQQQNLKTDFVQSQLDAQTSETQADINTRAAQQIFGSLSKFSQTAADAAEEESY